MKEDTQSGEAPQRVQISFDIAADKAENETIKETLKAKINSNRGKFTKLEAPEEPTFIDVDGEVFQVIAGDEEAGLIIPKGGGEVQFFVNHPEPKETVRHQDCKSLSLKQANSRLSNRFGKVLHGEDKELTAHLIEHGEALIKPYGGNEEPDTLKLCTLDSSDLELTPFAERYLEAIESLSLHGIVYATTQEMTEHLGYKGKDITHQSIKAAIDSELRSKDITVDIPPRKGEKARSIEGSLVTGVWEKRTNHNGTVSEVFHILACPRVIHSQVYNQITTISRRLLDAFTTGRTTPEATEVFKYIYKQVNGRMQGNKRGSETITTAEIYKVFARTKGENKSAEELTKHEKTSARNAAEKSFTLLKKEGLISGFKVKGTQRQITAYTVEVIIQKQLKSKV